MALRGFKVWACALALLASTLVALPQGGTTPTTRYQTVADMVAAPITAGASNTRITALVTGRVTANDGGGGLFFFTPASVTATNLGTIFPSTGVAGRWLREYSGALNVKWFGASGDGVTDSTAGIQGAINVAQTAAFPTTIYFPGNSVYLISSTLSVTNSGVTLKGDGEGVQIYMPSAPAGTYILDVDLSALSTQLKSFNIEGVFFNGDSGSTVHGARIHGSNTGGIRHTQFAFVNHALTLKDAYSCSYYDLFFRKYSLGITGTSGFSANNNVFSGISFFDGNSGATCVNDIGTGYNTWIECDFEGNNIKNVHFDNGTGYNKLIGCRFERINSAQNDSWLYVGSNNRLIDCSWHPDSSTLPGDGYFLTVISGNNNFLGNVNQDYPNHIVYIDASAFNNEVQFSNNDSLSSTDFEMPIIDYRGGNTNRIVWGKSDYMIGNITSQSFYPVKNLLANSLTFGSMTVDNGTLSYQAGDSGPLDDGHVYQMAVDGSGNTHNVYQSLSGLTSGAYYTFSFWAKNIVAGQQFGVIAGATTNSVSNMTGTLKGYFAPNGWVRLYRSFVPSGTTAVVGWSLKNGATDLRLYGAQVVLGRSPQGYVSTGSTARQDDAPFTPYRRYLDQAPTVGTWNIGDFVYNIAPSSGGNIGWICTSSGTPGTWVVAGAVGVGTLNQVPKFNASGLSNSSVSDDGTAVSSTEPVYVKGGNQVRYYNSANNDWWDVSTLTGSTRLDFGGVFAMQGAGGTNSLFPYATSTYSIGYAGRTWAKGYIDSIYITEGSNARMGTATLNGTTEVTVNNTSVTANTRIFLTVQAPGGTPSGGAYVSSRSAGTSFGIKALAALDTSTVAWLLVEPSP